MYTDEKPKAQQLGYVGPGSDTSWRLATQPSGSKYISTSDALQGLPPVDIPWKLLGTTGATVRDADSEEFAGAVGSAVSIFMYEPPAALTAEAYPGKRVIFLRACVTVAPGRLSEANLASLDDTVKLHQGAVATSARQAARPLLDWTDPARAVVLDLAVRQIPSDGIGKAWDADLMSKKPGAYFLAASPMRRETTNTYGISLGGQDDASTSVTIGDSMTHMRETSSLTSATNRYTAGGSASLNLRLFSISGGAQRTTTTTEVDGSRAMSLSSVNSEDASSAEHRRAFGYQTQVTNILALLSARYVGTPNLQFVMRPHPLRVPPREEMDSDTWYAELLENASRGLDGVQDFFGAVLMDRDGGVLAVKSRLRVAYCADRVLGAGGVNLDPFAVVGEVRCSDDHGIGENLALDIHEDWKEPVAMVEEYLARTFPPGTRVEALDIDAMGAVDVIRQHIPPADGPNGWRSVVLKPMGPTPVTIRRWIPALRLMSENDIVDRINKKTFCCGEVRGEDAILADVYTFMTVGWTEWVPWLPNRAANRAEYGQSDDAKNHRTFEGTYFGQMRPVLRTALLPYKPLSLVLQEAEANARIARLTQPLSSGTTYATTDELLVYESQQSKPKRTTNILSAGSGQRGQQGSLALVAAGWNDSDQTLVSRLLRDEPNLESAKATFSLKDVLSRRFDYMRPVLDGEVKHQLALLIDSMPCCCDGKGAGNSGSQGGVYKTKGTTHTAQGSDDDDESDSQNSRTGSGGATSQSSSSTAPSDPDRVLRPGQRGRDEEGDTYTQRYSPCQGYWRQYDRRARKPTIRVKGIDEEGYSSRSAEAISRDVRDEVSQGPGGHARLPDDVTVQPAASARGWPLGGMQ